MKFTLFVIKGGYLLALFCSPHFNASGELVQIVGVKRLTKLQHDVVGDVHGN